MPEGVEATTEVAAAGTAVTDMTGIGSELGLTGSELGVGTATGRDEGRAERCDFAVLIEGYIGDCVGEWDSVL